LKDIYKEEYGHYIISRGEGLDFVWKKRHVCVGRDTKGTGVSQILPFQLDGVFGGGGYIA
jgi:hypothetical protein